MSRRPVVRDGRRSLVARTARFRRCLRAAGQPCGDHRTRARRRAPCAERETPGHPRRRRCAPQVGRRARGARPPHGSQLASRANLPEGLGAHRRGRDRRRPLGPLVYAQDPAGDRRHGAWRRQLARRSEARGRRRSVRSRLACALLRSPLGRRSGARLGAARDAPLPRPAARGHRDARLADRLRREPNLPDLGRRRTLERDRDRRGAGRDPRRRQHCRPQIAFAGAPLDASLPVRRIASSGMVRRRRRRFSGRGDRRRRKQYR